MVLTPTSRLARAERKRLAAEASARGETAWRTPEVLSIPAWLARLRDDALLVGAIEGVVIGDDAAREIWREAIDSEVFIGEPRVVELAQRAWRTVHEHCLDAPEDWPEVLLSEDARAFQRWVRRFRSIARERDVVDEWTFAAALPGLIRTRALPLPGAVRRVGFELEPVPLVRALFEAMADAGIAIADPHGGRGAEPSEAATPTVRAYADDDSELRAAAAWARSRLAEQPEARLGIVVPDLAARLGAVERIFSAVFDPPGFALDDSREDRGDAAWHVSMGPALSDWPLVADALLVLGLGPNRIEQPRAGRLLRSPWLIDHELEQRPRAEAEARLMRWAPYALTTHELAFELKAAGAVRLAEALERWRATTIAHRDAAWPSGWTERFQTELSALGFGRGRALNSREFQVLQRWHDLLEAFAALDGTVAGPLSRSQALMRLAERARGVTFREADPGSAIEILGVQEALGARFDAAWLTTLDRDAWPAAARRDPLIPGPIQRAVPSSTAEGCRARARAELAGLARIAPELHGSFARGDDEIQRRCTPLLDADPIQETIETTIETTIEATDEAGAAAPVELEVVAEDRRAPPLERAEIRGGTAVLRDQSACPFRALAVHRWGALDLAPPRPGLDARLRGTLLHRALEAFWRKLEDRDALLALDAADRAARIEDAAAAALDGVLEKHRLTLSRAGRALEQRCTERLLDRWLDLERDRGPFEVIAREKKIALRFGPLTLSGTIDRIDRTPAGPLLIDYKTGSSGRNAWRPSARIDDPQLPAYALSMDEPPAALAFARLRPDDLGFDGLARNDVGARGVAELAGLGGAWKGVDDFDALLADWRTALDALAEDFAAGAATVDPREAKVCGDCHLHALCRIHERDPLAGSADTEGAE
ncbi:PD-(D/E)XK nuclease family protein [Halomonas denitrificans]|nr:PD-(D/E)XK nuclease family protein [Halomonas denitrificans]